MQEGLHTLASWAIVVYGATLVITGSRLFRPLRRRVWRLWRAAGRFLRCPMCVGGQVGWLVGLALPQLSPVHGTAWYLSIPANAAAGAGICWAAHVILAWLGAEDL